MKYTLLLLAIFSTYVSNGQTAMEIIEMMYKDAAKIDGFIAEINKEERLEDEVIIQLSKVKLSRHPYKVYIKQLAPKEGAEVLAFITSPPTKATVNLNSFPWINLYLDPYGSLMRRNQHHTVFDSGFDLMIKILKFELSSELSIERLERKEDVVWLGKEMYHLELSNNDFGIIQYRVKPEENVDDIANHLHINAYAIIEMNEDIDNYDDVEENQIINVPSHYAKRMILLIDKENHLPLVIKVYDQQGLYEKYEYNSIELNPVFAPNEFTEDFEHYNF
ncbi:MAG: DUF1571 domain-containing protein [Cyclobacteriaceae bacterium]|nr:DUF1571 domain-containing protein [Cyclobacteriaceae bacterium]